VIAAPQQHNNHHVILFLFQFHTKGNFNDLLHRVAGNPASVLESPSKKGPDLQKDCQKLLYVHVTLVYGY
jgi:hypothetical protein